MDKEQRKGLLKSVATAIVSDMVDFNYGSSSISTSGDNNDDYIYQYAQQLVSLGCFYLEYDDAIKEGDVERVFRCWKYLLPIFVNSGRKNYSIEALLLLCQHEYLLPPQQAKRLLYSRFVNTRGIQGRNIPADLHNEHLNKACKNAIGGLGSNLSTERIQMVGRSLGTLVPILDSFDIENNVSKSYGHHAPVSSEEDITILVNQLQQSEVFTSSRSREHASFQAKKAVLYSKSRKQILQWILTHIPYK